MKFFKIFIVICLLFLVTTLFFMEYLTTHYSFNYTGSLPKGWYRHRPFLKIERGDLVIFKIPKELKYIACQRGYLNASTNKMIKYVGAIKGDRVYQEGSSLVINDEIYATIDKRDRSGQQLMVAGRRLIPREDEFLPLSKYSPYSWDGRYYGVIKKKEILFKVSKSNWIEIFFLFSLSSYF